MKAASLQQASTRASFKSRLSADGKTLTISIPYACQKHRSGKQIVTPDGSQWAPSARIDGALVQAVVRAHRRRELLETGQYGTAADLAKAEKVNDSYLSRVLRLTLLAPDIVESILDGRQPRSLELGALLQPLPFIWEQQKELLGFQGEHGGEIPKLLLLSMRMRMAR
jgi:hypothetical protein